jgi:DNA polymerase III sliding clamp (beta) subunit (PCNA family)
MRQAVKRVTILSTTDDCAVVIQFTNETEIQVEAKDTVEGDSAADVFAASVVVSEGVLPRRVKFQAKYLLDAIGALGERVRMRVGDGKRPAAFETDGKPGDGVQIVMPRDLREDDVKAA